MARIDVESSMWSSCPELDMRSPTVLIPSQVGRIEERSDDAPAVRLHQDRRLPERRFAWSSLLSETGWSDWVDALTSDGKTGAIV